MFICPRVDRMTTTIACASPRDPIMPAQILTPPPRPYFFFLYRAVPRHASMPYLAMFEITRSQIPGTGRLDENGIL